MKRFILAFSLLLSAVAGAQAIEKKVGDFRKIKVFDRITVELVLGDEQKVQISGDRAKDVIIVNNNGELKIAMPPQKLLEGEEVEVKVFYEYLTEITATEGTYVSSAEKVAEPNLTLDAKEGGQIKLELIKTKALGVRAVTGGKIMLSGAVENNKVSLGTGGIFEGKDLVTKNTDVNINAGGEADVNATDFVMARTKAGGDITIYGKPAKIDKKTVLGGSIEEAR